jgi:hypothetical protein
MGVGASRCGFNLCNKRKDRGGSSMAWWQGNVLEGGREVMEMMGHRSVGHSGAKVA